MADGYGSPHQVTNILCALHSEAFGLTKYFHSVNGCSMKTEDNLAAVKSIRLEWLMVETGELLGSSNRRYFHSWSQ